MFPKTSLMIIGYRRVCLVIALGLDQAVCASDRAEILMPRSLQANCNQVWSSSIHGDRWWNKRVWTSWWIKRIWEPRIWSSCWFYCCSTGLTVIFSHICGVCVCRVIFLIHFHMTLLAGQGAQRSLMQRAQTFSDPFWALPSPSKIMSVLRLIDSSWRVLSFWYPSQIRFFECFVLMSCFDAACHLAQHVLVQCTALSDTRFPFRVGIPNSIQSSKVRKEEDFENFICWACNSLAGPGTTVICDNVRPHAWTFCESLCNSTGLCHISTWSLEASTHFTRRILWQWFRGNEHWGFVKKKIWKHCQQKLWTSMFH